jgi:hypothetical protein
MYLKLTNLFIYFIPLSILSNCNNFEREAELKKFLKNELRINHDAKEILQVFILQDKICGACTDEVLSFIYSLDHEHSLVAVSNESKELIKQLKTNIGEKNIFVDSNKSIDRHGLRYARDLVVLFRQGELVFWSFIEHDKFDKIKKGLRKGIL